ncbi:MAG: hypothetical protein KC652_17640 [Cyanobacteria bacterium HKST-UBA01]|nr:hypothetical protein [Cyanobacteria bacterium HKST-UBA01]
MKSEQARSKAEKYLASSMSPHGWWSYKDGNGPSLEATAWCAFALADRKELASQVIRFLSAQQNEDGGWSTAPDTGFSDWVTGPALMAIREISRKNPELLPKPVLKKGMLHLADSRPYFYPVVGRLLLLISKGPEGVHFPRGWPWDPECFHWVEPTSYHLFALKVPGMPEQEVYRSIVDHANRYILKRVCKGGGWNYGNRETLGAFLTPFRVTTAEALLALQDVDRNEAINESLSHLESYRDADTSTLGLAWSILCLDAYGKSYERELEFLVGRQKEDGSFTDNNVANAMAYLALTCAEGANRLKFGKI